MNREILLEYMRKPSLLAGASLADLEKLTSDFPYSPITHLLYIKALSEQKSIHYHNQLKLTAAHVSDRSVLYYLLNGSEGISLFEPATVVKAFADPPAETKIPIKEPLPAAETAEEKTIGLDALIQQVKALSSLEIPALDGFSQKLSQLENEHAKRVEDIARTYLTLREIALSAKLPEPVEAEKEAPVIETETEQLQTTPVAKEEPAMLPREPEPGSKKAELIDKFIETAPSMPKPKKDFFSASNMAQTSTIDKEDLVSETLAAIHLKQGNIQKALKIYRRLCLIIPEKSTYFAAQIENIKKENNLL